MRLFGAKRHTQAHIEYKHTHTHSTHTHRYIHTQPFRFTIELCVKGLPRVFTERNLIIVCEGRKISMALKSSIPYSDVNGRDATLSVTNVEDAAARTHTHARAQLGTFAHTKHIHTHTLTHTLAQGNVASTVSSMFSFAKVDLASAAVSIKGFILGLPYKTTFANPSSVDFLNVSTGLAKDIAALLHTNPARVKTTTISEANQGLANMFFVCSCVLCMTNI
jgi:hypothetical protein